MARTAIPTHTTGQLVTAAYLNTYLRDNEVAHWPYTNAGDMIHATAADTLARLAIGTVGEVQRVSAGETAPEWGGLLNALISDTTPRAIPDATYTEVTLTIEDVDIDEFVANPVANKITIPANFDGNYLINYHVEYASNATGFREIVLCVNGPQISFSEVRIPAINGDTTITFGSRVRPFLAADVITLKTWQNSGGNLNVINAELGLVRL